MPTIKTTYNLVCCGPSDVEREVLLVEQAVERWNRSRGIEHEQAVHFSHWKTDATPDLSGRPQAVINRQIIDSADIVVAIFWGRFGTPTGRAESGTEEEILRAIKQKKRVLLYFSDLVSSKQIHDEGQYQKVQQFRQAMSDQGLYWTFKSRRELEQLLSMHLGRTLEVFKTLAKAVRTVRRKSQSKISQKGEVNINAPGDGDHRSVTLNIHHPSPKSPPKSRYASNSIGGNANLLNYIDYLFGLAVEYWEKIPDMNPGRIGQMIKRKFRLKLRTRNHLSVDRFDDLVDFIIRDLLMPSPVGKRHIRDGTRLCRTFDEFNSGPI